MTCSLWEWRSSETTRVTGYTWQLACERSTLSKSRVRTRWIRTIVVSQCFQIQFRKILNAWPGSLESCGVTENAQASNVLSTHSVGQGWRASWRKSHVNRYARHPHLFIWTWLPASWLTGLLNFPLQVTAKIFWSWENQNQFHFQGDAVMHFTDKNILPNF